jgi:RNA polymerase sigma-70 factor (ECF subfamily)
MNEAEKGIFSSPDRLYTGTKMSQDEAVGLLEPVISAMPRHDGFTKSADKNVPTFDDIMAHRESVFRICLGFSRNYAEAEDLAQDAYVRAFARLKSLRNPAQTKEWLFRIAKNTCLDRQKRERNRARLIRRWTERARSKNEAPAERPGDERLTVLKAAVRTLPKKLGEVFVLREYGRLSYTEIAATLRLKQGTVMSRLNRARKRVAAGVEENIR